MMRIKSEQFYQRASKIMPGGVSSPVRAFRAVGGTPIYFKRAAGAHFWDEDGNQYLDFCMSWGPLILGHARAEAVEAVQKAAQDGLTYGACCAKEVELAELILAAFKSMDQVRLVSSGTEAVMTAIRLARGVTGRSTILKFAGGYHGHSDSLLVKAGSGLATLGTASSQGVPECLANQTLVLPFDDSSALEEVFSKVGDQLAAVVVEPLPANEGLLEQRPEWLRRLRQLTTQHGVLLIFDEVISGFRLHYGGYGDRLGIQADLVTLGKIVGGGMPAAALVGPYAIMSHLAPQGGVYQAGTLSGNPVSLAAGIATLRELSKNSVYSRLESLGEALDQSLKSLGGDLPQLCWRRVGSIVWFHLVPGPIPRRADAISKDAVERFNGLHARLLDSGLYLPPSAYEVLFVSAAHTAADMEHLARHLVEQLK